LRRECVSFQYAEMLIDGKISCTMQFLRATDSASGEELRLSSPLLNELKILELGRENAQMWQFGSGISTQANWQGAPSRGPV
jgi:hypothetical protein